MKKFARVILIFILAFASLSLFACAPSIETKGIKNVIVIIGDGMGFNHVENAKNYFGLGRQQFEEYAFESITYSNNDPITDSAAGATAISCGIKVDNGNVAKFDGKNLQTLTEYAISKGKKTAILTTDELSGATPASFSSHANNRADTNAIIDGQLASNVDLFIGKDSSVYSPRIDEWQAKGYRYATSFEQLSSLDNSTKVIAELDNIKSVYNSTYANQIEFKEVVEYALNFLEGDNGYFMMIEGAYIDKFSHSNNFNGAMCETRSLFDVINYLYSAVGDDTAIIVTADHETGGLELGNDSSWGNGLYTRTSHSGANVPLYLKNVKLKHTDKCVENTYIYKIAKTALGG